MYHGLIFYCTECRDFFDLQTKPMPNKMKCPLCKFENKVYYRKHLKKEVERVHGILVVPVGSEIWHKLYKLTQENKSVIRSLQIVTV